MNYRCLRPLFTLAALVLLRVPGQTQNPVLASLRGEIHSDRPTLPDYLVDLYDVLNRREVDHSFVRSDGGFEFHNVPYGEYQVRVADSNGEIVQLQTVAVNSNTLPLELELHLPREHVSRPPSGPVSVTQLSHPPGRKALAAFAAAQRLAASGRYDRAAEELGKAIRISPEFAEAHTNLAAYQARMGRFEDTIRESRRAMELTRPNAADLSNMAYALSRLQRYSEAVDAARGAVRLEPGNDKARYMLGSLLVMDWRTIREGITHLERVVGSVPAAQAGLDGAKKTLSKCEVSRETCRF